MRPQIVSGPNNLKILICHNSSSLSTSLFILVRAGTDYEEKEINGISHFIEHLYFKGTKNYPTAKILMESIDQLGGSYNAFTNHQYTGFYIKVLPEYTEKALFILSDIILNPLFPEEEIEKERKVIFEEINLWNDSPNQLIIDLGTRLTFGDQPAGWSILGSKETISRIKRKDILNYVKKNYSTRETLIVLSGQIKNEKKLIKLIKEKFQDYNFKAYPPKKKFRQPKNNYQEKIYHKQVEQAHIFLGFPLPGIYELKERRYFFNLISIILGEKSSSRLFLKVREELGAAYYVRSNFLEYTDRSLFFIHAGINLEKLELVLEEIIKEINKLKKEGPAEKELETAKAILKSSLFMDLEESLGTAIFYGRQYFLEKKLQTPKEINQKIDSLKEKDLLKELKNNFTFSQAKFAVILPKNLKINFSKIFKSLIE